MNRKYVNATEVPITVVSGGQTGVDRAALSAARSLCIPYGGWLPKGRITEAGPLEPSFEGMKEMPTKDYLKRTERNVVDSEATVVLCHGEPEGGTRRTVGFAEKHGRRCLVIDLDGDRAAAQAALLGLMLRDCCEGRINFAGPRESKRPGVGAEAEAFLSEVFTAYLSELRRQIADMDSGMAGAVRSAMRGIPIDLEGEGDV